MVTIYIMNDTDMVVEIPYNSFVKYEYDKKKEVMRCDRVLHTAMAYPGNYGYFPNTLSGDGDPLDVLLICDYPIYPGIYVKVRIVGALLTADENGNDEKIIAVPNIKVDPNYTHINNYTDLPKWTLSKIQHFFKHYKDTENDKWVEVKGFVDKDDAIELYKMSLVK
jgi:inorganic pyrophosphatase